MGEQLEFNGYGHTKCPQCGEHYRYMATEHGNDVVCDCGFREQATRDNSNEYSAADLEEVV